MSSPSNKYWFPAKRYGWGWGLPTCWQGWVVFGVYVVLFALGTLLLQDGSHGRFIGFVTVITLGLVIVCWIKGEPPRWRWGDD